MSTFFTKLRKVKRLSDKNISSLFGILAGFALAFNFPLWLLRGVFLALCFIFPPYPIIAYVILAFTLENSDISKEEFDALMKEN